MSIPYVSLKNNAIMLQYDVLENKNASSGFYPDMRRCENDDW